MATPTSVEDQAHKVQQETRKVVRRALPPAIVALSVLAAVVFAYLAVDLSMSPERGVVVDDPTISNYLMHHPEGLLTNVWLGITLIGNGVPLILITLAFVVYLIRDHHVQMAIALILTAGTGEAVNEILKLLFHRARPAWVPALVHPAGYSFPSGHSMGSMIVYGFMIYALLTTQQGRWRYWVSAGLAVLIALIATSRVVLGAHWLTDVIGGLAAGLVWLVICISVADWAGARSWYPRWLHRRKT